MMKIIKTIMAKVGSIVRVSKVAISPPIQPPIIGTDVSKPMINANVSAFGTPKAYIGTKFKNPTD